MITALAGQDATQDFEDIAHSDSSRTWANKYIIGHIEGANDSAKTIELPILNAAKDNSNGKGDGMWLALATVGVVSVGLVGYMFVK